MNPPLRRGDRRARATPRRAWRLTAATLVIAAGCFTDPGPDLQTNTGLSTTMMPTSSTGGESLPTTTSSSSSSGTTGAPVAPGITFRLSSLSFVDPHVFLTEGGGDTGTTGAPVSCTDATGGLNSVLNMDIADGNFSLMIHFDDLTPGAELRLFEGECSRPDQASQWTCLKKDGSLQTIFGTDLVQAPPCRDIDVGLFQAVNVPVLSDPQPPCVRTEKLDFSIPIGNTGGSLNLREAQMVATPDMFIDPTGVPTGIIYGFLPQVSAMGIEIEVPLFGVVNLWEVIDVPGCAADYPEQVPSVETYDLGGGPVQGVWLAINFTAERVIYLP